MFDKLLIANRGEIAVRIIGTARRLGIGTVAVYSDADVRSLHVEMADEAWRIGPPPAAQSYLDQDVIISKALKSGAQAIHPGYGFLSENPDFAEAVAGAGLVFVGPPPAAIRAMGLKNEAKRLMGKAGVPVVPGYSGADQDLSTLKREAVRIGFPVLVKPVAGGGGKGMRRIETPEALEQGIAASQREALSAFGNGELLLEKFVAKARHIEVQVMADGRGNIIHLYERDCSLQRRHQKVIEETPAPGLTQAMRETLCEAAIAAARAVGYVNAGTVEFIADISEGLRADRFYFMEMNTRLQVEHPVTELATGVDLVELQLRVAAGEVLPLRQKDVSIQGHAMEARLYAEDPAHGFQPQTGRLSMLHFEPQPFLRLDTGVRNGDSVLPYYDPMIAKLSVHAPSRGEAVSRLAHSLATGQATGCRTNLEFLTCLLKHPQVTSGDVDTNLIAREIGSLLTETAPPMGAIAAALLAACGYLTQPASHSPFDTLTGFRLWDGEAETRQFLVRGRRLSCTLARHGRRFTATCEARTLHFRLLAFGPPVLRLDCEDRVSTFTILAEDTTLIVACDDGRHEFESADAAEVSAGAAAGGGLVVSPMPGQVRKVFVKAGDRVVQGAPVVIIEAMKMELSLYAERSGRVIEVSAAEGDQIREGTVLLRIGDADG